MTEQQTIPSIPTTPRPTMDVAEAAVLLGVSPWLVLQQIGLAVEHLGVPAALVVAVHRPVPAPGPLHPAHVCSMSRQVSRRPQDRTPAENLFPENSPEGSSEAQQGPVRPGPVAFCPTSAPQEVLGSVQPTCSAAQKGRLTSGFVWGE